MTYKPPNVEEYSDTDDNIATSKRKRNVKAPDRFDPENVESQEPPAKAAKPSATPADADPDIDEEDEVDEEDDNIYEDYHDQDLSADDEDDTDEEEEDLGDQDEVDGVPGLEADEDEDDNDNADDDVGEEEDAPEEDATDRPKVRKAVDKFGRAPLDGTAIGKKPLTASADTLLAMVMDALLKSRPISHDLSQRAVQTLVDEGYHDIGKLGDSSWEERTVVLKNGGYNRYREQGATSLGELAEFINEKYDGDLNNLWEAAHHDRDQTRELVKEIKGLGDLGVDLFFNNVQSVWPSIAPFLDGRSLETAEEVGIGSDLDAIYAELEGDALMMSRLANGLSAARLEKRQGELLRI